MTFLEALLIVAVAALGIQLLLLQRHYDEKLSDQAGLIDYIIRQTGLEGKDNQMDENIRTKLFNSSQ